MPAPVWIALALLLFATTAGAVYVFLRLRRFWRTFKSFSSTMEESVGRLTRSLDRLSDNQASFGAATPKLEASLARLRGSLARTAVLRAAVRDAQDSLGRLTAVYPRK
jgi:hypothetical protein